MSNKLEINSIKQAHNLLGLAPPKHPLITVVYNSEVKARSEVQNIKLIYNLYQVSLKLSNSCGKINYGKNSYDYEEGTLVFSAPGQVIEYQNSGEVQDENQEGWTLAFHPDLIRKYKLADNISKYSFFDYDIHEALHLSDDERKTIEELIDKIVREFSQNLDRHSQHLIVANIELLLDYCSRFYDRQFISRLNLNGDVISKFDRLIKDYYQSEKAIVLGIPSVMHCANELNLSASYLSDLLKKETGKTAQEHIHLFLIEKAKNSLLNSTHPISEIAYGLGFEYPQHFSNLFKLKTGFSPREFRNQN